MTKIDVMRYVEVGYRVELLCPGGVSSHDLQTDVMHVGLGACVDGLLAKARCENSDSRCSLSWTAWECITERQPEAGFPCIRGRISARTKSRLASYHRAELQLLRVNPPCLHRSLLGPEASRPCRLEP